MKMTIWMIISGCMVAFTYWVRLLFLPLGKVKVELDLGIVFIAEGQDTSKRTALLVKGQLVSPGKGPGVVAQAFNPSSLEAETYRSL